MRYSSEHKGQSRERILEAARRLFRRRGFDAASIDQVMNAAGLTRGAFYAHFDSKEDLIRRVLEIESGLANSLGRAADAADPPAAALAALADYLDPRQRENVATGCPLVAHPVDAIRGDAGRKSGYTDRLTALVDSVQSAIGTDRPREDAVLIAVLTIGAGLLSAASSDAGFADQIEQVSLDRIRDIVMAPAS